MPLLASLLSLGRAQTSLSISFSLQTAFSYVYIIQYSIDWSTYSWYLLYSTDAMLCEWLNYLIIYRGSKTREKVVDDSKTLNNHYKHTNFFREPLLHKLWKKFAPNFRKTINLWTSTRTFNWRYRLCGNGYYCVIVYVP